MLSLGYWLFGGFTGIEPATTYMYWWEVGHLGGLISERGRMVWVWGIAVPYWGKDKGRLGGASAVDFWAD